MNTKTLLIYILQHHISLKPNTWYVYQLKLNDDSSYVGVSKDVVNRLLQHLNSSWYPRFNKQPRRVISIELIKSYPTVEQALQQEKELHKQLGLKYRRSYRNQVGRRKVSET